MAKTPQIRRGGLYNPPQFANVNVSLSEPGGGPLLQEGETLTKLYVQWRFFSNSTAGIDEQENEKVVSLAVVFGDPPGPPIDLRLNPFFPGIIWQEGVFAAFPQGGINTGSTLFIGGDFGTRWQTQGQRTTPAGEQGEVVLQYSQDGTALVGFGCNFQAVVLLP